MLTKAPRLIDAVNMDSTEIPLANKSIEEIHAEWLIPAQEMKPWRDFRATICSFCGKSQREKLLCGKVRHAFESFL